MEIFKLVKELGFETLPMMTDFMKDLEIYLSDYSDLDADQKRIRYHFDTMNYRELIIQPFTEGQFIPCDKEGKPMAEPPQWSGSWEFEKKQEVNSANEAFRQAVDAVIFEPEHGTKFHELSDGNIGQLNNPRIYMKGTIESYINSGGKLTPIIK